MFVTAGDFNIPPFDIPNLDKVPNTFGPYVDQEEKECLNNLLGSLLCDAFIEALFTVAAGVYTPIDENTIEQRWKDLRDGVQYTYNNRRYKWKGMKEMLKPYICAMWSKHNADSYTGAGVVVPNTENSIQVGPGDRIVRNFNLFSVIAGNPPNQIEHSLYLYLFSSDDKYTDVLDPDFSSIQSYLNAVYKCPGKMNAFDL